jgi:hypothetical protein
VDGQPGIIIAPLGRLFAVLDLTVNDGQIIGLNVIAGSARLDQIILGVVKFGASSASGRQQGVAEEHHPR